MKIEKGTVLEVSHSRKGRFIATAYEDFETDDTEWYPVIVTQDDAVGGLTEDWATGEKIPCRKSLCTIKVIAKL